jgi:integrase
MSLNDTVIRKLKVPRTGKRREYYDRQIPGFGIRITDRGVRSYILIYTHNGRRRRYTIGRVGEISLEDARELARQLRGQVRREGRDPAAEQKAARALAKVATAKNFADVVELYTKRDLAQRRRGREARMTIDLHLMPAWGALPITSITRAHVIAKIESLVDAGMSGGAERVFALARRIFSWAISRGEFGIERSPFEKLRVADIVGKRTFRTRILSDREWRALFRAAPALGHPFESIIYLLARTGLRRSEIAEARFAEFDLDQKLWTIPSNRMKADAPHTVPLTDEMLGILRSLPRTGEFLFPTERGDRPVSGFSAIKRKLDREMHSELAREAGEDVALEPWTFHDVRRSMRTQLSSLPVPGGDLVRELLLAHSKPELHRIYDQFAYLDEKRRALELWQEKLQAILEVRSADVVSMPQRA